MRKKTDKISIVPAIPAMSRNILDIIGTIRWTNRHDCPEGYAFNEDGYVQTDENRLQVSVNMLPFLLPTLGEYGVLFQNAVALRMLNHNKPRDIIQDVLKYKFNTSYYRKPDPLLLAKAVSDAYCLDSLSEVLPKMHTSIFCFHDIWYSKDCTEGGRKQIQKLLRNDYIDKSRQLMSIDTKYKTKEVAAFVDESLHAVNCYWTKTGLDKKNRTIQSVIESVDKLKSIGIENYTYNDIARLSGLTRQTIGLTLKEIGLKDEG